MTTEFWVVKSENDLKEGALAYWGPWPTREQAIREFEPDEVAGETIIEIPGPTPEDENVCTCEPQRPEGRAWFAHQPECPLRTSLRAAGSA